VDCAWVSRERRRSSGSVERREEGKRLPFEK